MRTNRTAGRPGHGRGAGRSRRRPRLVAGVSGQVAARLGVDVVHVRLAFLVLAFAGGVGLVAYPAAMLVLPAPDDDDVEPWSRGAGVRTAALAVVVFGALAVARATGLWFGDALVWPVAAVAAALGVVRSLTTGSRPVANVTLAAALGDAAAAVAGELGVPVEVECRADLPLRGLEPLVLAAREGMRNAARHSGAGRVAVRVDRFGHDAVVLVRDRGHGFDPAGVAPTGGLATAVVRPLRAAGGGATVRSRPGMGCELELRLPGAAAERS